MAKKKKVLVTDWLTAQALDDKADSIHIHPEYDNSSELAAHIEDVTTNPHQVTKEQVGLGNLTNEAQIPLTQKAAINGVATLDANGKIPVGQMIASVMEYQGIWNADTNTPALQDGIGDVGDVFKVDVAGTRDLGSGAITFNRNDWITYNGTKWEKSNHCPEDLVALSNTVPLVNNTVALAGTAVEASRQDHVHPIDETRAPVVHSHLTLDTATTRELHVDCNRTDEYVATGSDTKPFKTIQAAIDAIILAADDLLNPYNVKIATGKYYENIVIEHANIHRIKLTGEGVVQIRPTTGMALRCTAENAGLYQFHVTGITFLAPVVITGIPLSVAFDDVIWEDCNFVNGDGAQAGSLLVTCVNNFSLKHIFNFATNPLIFNNVNYILLSDSNLSSEVTVSMDSSESLPSQGHQGGMVVNNSIISGHFNFSLEGPSKAFQIVSTSSRIARNTSTVNIPAGAIVTAYNSFFRGTWNNAGVIYLRNSFIEIPTGVDLNIDQQKSSQIKNSSTVTGNSVTDALNTLSGQIISSAPTIVEGINITNQAGNATIVVPQGKYNPGTLALYVNGSKQTRTIVGQESSGNFIETDPSTGTATWTGTPPISGTDVITTSYHYNP